MIYDDNYAECIGIYQDQGERKSETMIKKKAIFAVITMMMLILAAGCGYTSDEACIWCGAAADQSDQKRAGRGDRDELLLRGMLDDLFSVRGKGDTAVYQ